MHFPHIYLYVDITTKKTGNVWTGVFIATTVMVLMATTITRHTSDIAFFC